MEDLRSYLIFSFCLFTEGLFPVMTLPLKDTSTNISDYASVDFSDARADEDFNFDGRIVGGFVTSIANYPYQVSLQYHNAHICGGSIVAQNIILTAAHCIEQPWDTESFRVRAGSSTHLYGGQLLDVRHIFKHEAYNTSTLDSDVALVVLYKNLAYTRFVQPVDLAEWKALLPNKENELIVTGWGLTTDMGIVSPLLNYVAVHLINQTTCSHNYQYIATISTKMFCAGSPHGGKDSCQGDSGGPLVSYAQPSLLPASGSNFKSKGSDEAQRKLRWQRNVLKPTQYGIVSWGVGCGETHYPGVYANVATLRLWIDEKINEVNYL